MSREVRINRTPAIRPLTVENRLAARTRVVKESRPLFVASALALSTVFGCANIAEMGAKEKERLSAIADKDAGLPDVIEENAKDVDVDHLNPDVQEDVLSEVGPDVVSDVGQDVADDVADVIQDVVNEEGGLPPLVPVLIGKSNLVGLDDFTLPPSNAIPDGWLILMRNNLKCWKASDNIMPSAAADPWVLAPVSPPAGSISAGVEVDTATNEGAIWLNTMTSDSSLSWSRGAGFDNGNQNIWCVQGRARIENSTAKGQGSSFGIMDGTKALQLGLLPNLVRDTDNDSIQGAAIDMSSAAHSLMICGGGSDYIVFADEAIATRLPIAINGVGKLLLPSSENRIQFGDLSSASGINAFAHYMHFCSVNNFTGYVASGSVNLLFDLGSSTNNLGSGEVKPVAIGTLPAGTNLAVNGVRGGSNLPLSGSFSPLGSSGEISGVSGRYVEAEVELTTNIPGGYETYSPVFKGINFQGLTGSVDN